jgi:hypothetical protein
MPKLPEYATKKDLKLLYKDVNKELVSFFSDLVKLKRIVEKHIGSKPPRKPRTKKTVKAIELGLQ